METSDPELLDAYSRAVIAIVDQVGPSVVSINVGVRRRGRGPDISGAGSGVILIVLINEQVVASVDDLHRFLAEWPIGKPVTLTIVRGGERLQLQVIPVEVP